MYHLGIPTTRGSHMWEIDCLPSRVSMLLLMMMMMMMMMMMI